MEKQDLIRIASKKLKESAHNYLQNKSGLLNKKLTNDTAINSDDLDKKLDPILNNIPKANDIFSEAVKFIENRMKNWRLPDLWH